MMNKLFALLLAFSLTINTYAQLLRESVESIIETLMERRIEQSESNLDYNDLQAHLLHYAENKLDLNKVTHSELQQLFFLSELQIQAIISHRNLYGNFLSVYELQTINALDENTIYFLSYFVAVDEDWQANQTNLLAMFKESNHEFIWLADTELQQRKGYKAVDSLTASNHYLGRQIRQVFRYRMSFGQHLSIGYSGEKDAGEAFAFQSKIKGFDFHSAHVFYQPPKGLIKVIALGDYQINIGQGLTFSSGIGARKGALVLDVRRSNQVIRPYRSLNENEFLRGTAVTFRYKNFNGTAFGSRKPITTNLTLTDNADNDTYFTSITASGLHRTPAELKRKNNVLQTIAGLQMAFQFNKIEIGLLRVHAFYNQSIKQGDAPYQKYQFSGNQLQHSGLYYNYQWRNFNSFGEFSLNDNGAYAFTAGCVIALDVSLDLICLYRNFAKNYQTTFANPFAEFADVKNEQGYYSGFMFKLNRKWNWNGYIDIYQSKWLRYLVDGPSYGMDVLQELHFQPSKKTQMYFRFKREIRQRNQPDNLTVSDYLNEQIRSNYRLHLQQKVSILLTLKSRIELVTFALEGNKQQTGVLIFQDASWRNQTNKFSITSRLALFNVDDYNARVYAAENDVLHQFSVPMYQYSGVRMYVVVRLKLRRNLDVWLKLSETKYSNVNTISSGLELINGNRITDVRLQMRYNF
ncbi:MAG: helix-hairpin-helix domain-containing protein [Bacteroidia bacterium]|nr:helix-hairpin-helix domain-containing protein [Bacteroidia bacterium]